MKREEIVKEIKTYLAENIEDFEMRAELAWNNMCRWRCPLSYAAPSLEMAMEDYALEWFEENCDGGDEAFYEMFDNMEEFI